MALSRRAISAETVFSLLAPEAASPTVRNIPFGLPYQHSFITRSFLAGSATTMVVHVPLGRRMYRSQRILALSLVGTALISFIYLKTGSDAALPKKYTWWNDQYDVPSHHDLPGLLEVVDLTGDEEVLAQEVSEINSPGSNGSEALEGLEDVPLLAIAHETSGIKHSPNPLVLDLSDYSDDVRNIILRLLEADKASIARPHVHEYLSNGLLVTNSDGPHPIFELIERARASWQKKLDSSSKTLAEAVEEYKRRYRRPPPLGFDAWWFYVEENDVRLPDEYDQIFHDLEPLWGIDPRELQRVQHAREEHSDSFTLVKSKDGPVTIARTSFSSESSHLLDGAHRVIDMLENVTEWIPAFRAVFTPHDNPDVVNYYELKQQAVAAAAQGTVMDISNFRPDPDSPFGWLAACPKDSPARVHGVNWTGTADPQTHKTFIHDHKRTMDPCEHPSLFRLHGQFLSHNEGPSPSSTITPFFSWCSTTLHSDIIPVVSMSWVDDILPRSHDPQWDDKPDERLLWRGSNTGMWQGPTTHWRGQHRIRLLHETNSRDGTISVLKTQETNSTRVGEPEEIRRALINPAYMDMAFSGESPVGCQEETCQELRQMFEWRQHQDTKGAGQYKYVFDIDGNGWSSRFKRLITSNSLVFKSTIYPEWYQDRIQPWVHYVPIQQDLSDLYDAFAFFHGNLRGEGGHPDMARSIAVAGREWSKTLWRKEDMTAYMFRLFLEYARVMSPDRDKMTWDNPDAVWYGLEEDN